MTHTARSMTNPFCFDELFLSRSQFFFSTHTQYIFGQFFKKRKNIKNKVFFVTIHILSSRLYFREREGTTKKEAPEYREKEKNDSNKSK